jgi:hypothetical protein
VEVERFRAKHALGLDPGVGTGSRKENASKQKTQIEDSNLGAPSISSHPRSNSLSSWEQTGDLRVAFRWERAVAGKSEFVDMISEATRQGRRKVGPRVAEPEAKETSRLSNWPPDRWQQWRMETLTPWKIRSWKFKNWD